MKKVKPNWIPLHQSGYEAFDVQVDANASHTSQIAFRHKLRSYTGQTSAAWRYGKPPVALPPAPESIGSIMQRTCRNTIITIVVLAFCMIAAFRGNPEFVVPRGKVDVPVSYLP